MTETVYQFEGDPSINAAMALDEKREKIVFLFKFNSPELLEEFHTRITEYSSTQELTIGQAVYVIAAMSCEGLIF